MATDTQQHSSIDMGSNRSFGLVFAVVFATVGLYPLIHGETVRLWALVTALVFTLLAFFFAKLLQPFNLLWFKFGLLLARIVNPVVMFVVYVTTVVPIGLIMRILGKDLLKLKLDDKQKSYWVERTPPGPSPESLEEQF